jgi:hypothetical protein
MYDSHMQSAAAAVLAIRAACRKSGSVAGWRDGGVMRNLGCLLTVFFVLLANAGSAADRPVQGTASPVGVQKAATAERASDPTLQTDLWISHLKRFMAAHELTGEQQAVVAEGSDLLANGLLRRIHSAAAGEATEARSALSSFKARASRVFSKELYIEAFVRLERPSSLLKAGVPGSATPQIPYCDCDPSTGDCAGECVTGHCRVMPDGCGIFGSQICYGLCS